MSEETGKAEMVEPKEPEVKEPEAKEPKGAEIAPKAEELQAELEAARKALKEANKESAERRKKLEAFEKAEADRKAAEMTEAEKQQARIKELEGIAADYEAKVKQAERRELQRKVAKEVGIPEVFAGRIAGDTEEEMTEDAKLILEALPKPETKEEKKPTTPKLNVTNPADGKRGETKEQMRERLGFGRGGNVFDSGTVTFVEKE